MFNDDVLAKCPKCGSPDTAMTRNEITCNGCGYNEPLVIGEEARDSMQQDVANALNMAKARDVLQRWGFAG